MTAAERVNQIAAFLSGSGVQAGDYTISLPGGGKVDFTLSQNGGDLNLQFTNRKPVVKWFVFKGEIKGLKICVKGITVDVAELPERADPFIPWEKVKTS